MKKEVWKENDKLKLIDLNTGKIKIVTLITDKQVKLIASLEEELGLKHKNYLNKSIWAASKVIDDLQTRAKQKRLL